LKKGRSRVKRERAPSQNSAVSSALGKTWRRRMGRLGKRSKSTRNMASVTAKVLVRISVW